MLKKFFTFAWIVLLSLSSFSGSPAQVAPDWTNPFNLSKSGAASQPKLFSLPDGRLQAFWWDRFDGLLTASTDADGVWSEPVSARIRSNNLKSTPELFLDPSGTIYAFWTETQGGSGPAAGQEALFYSQINVGETTWSIPQKMTDSAVAFDVKRSEAGELHLAFVRQLNTTALPAGVYLVKKSTPRARWSNPTLVHASKYVRLLTPETAQLQLMLTGSPASTQIDYLLWFDPLPEEMVLAFSLDGGSTWSQPRVLETEDKTFTTPGLIPGQPAYLTWQNILQGNCSVFQQEIILEEAESGLALRSGALEPIMERISDCPSGAERFQTLGGQLLWIWGEGTSRLSLAARDDARNQWSLPNQFSVSFQDPQINRGVSLDDLHAAFVGEQLYIIGVDPVGGEVWTAQASGSLLDLAYAEPLPWSQVEPIPLGGQAAGAPAMAADGSGRTHVVWSVSTSPSGPGISLQYAQSSPSGVFGPFVLIPSAKGNIARQPALHYEAGRERLHLVWSGGTDGSLLYSWVGVKEAGSLAAWSPPATLSDLADASWPTMAQDSTGALFVLYVVPLNEARGVYLSRSTDGGESWGDPILVFDASQNQVPMVSHPTLAVGLDGKLHAAWVNAQAPGIGGPLSIQYALSADRGGTWSPPIILAAEDFSWSRLAIASGRLHLIYASEKGGLSAIYQRSILTEMDPLVSSAWEPPMAVPGWRNIALPFGLAASGLGGPAGSLYLLGADASAGILNYAAWEGDRWSPIESRSEVSLVDRGLGVSAAIPALGGQLSVSWLGYPVEDGNEEANVEPGLFLISRLVPTLAEVATIQPAGTPTAPAPTETPTPTLQPTVPPTATPQLNAPVQNKSLPLPLPPMAIGGLLVGFVVVLIFTGRILIKRTTDRHY